MAKRRDATEPRDADLLTDSLLAAVPEPKPPEPEPEPTPARKITRHETGRKARQMSLTFPSPAWKEAINDQAAKWDLRPSDLLVFCVSYALGEIAEGRAERPAGEIDRHRQRAGEGLDLPWTP